MKTAREPIVLESWKRPLARLIAKIRRGTGRLTRLGQTNTPKASPDPSQAPRPGVQARPGQPSDSHEVRPKQTLEILHITMPLTWYHPEVEHD